jgi:hypothetical protein
LTHAEPVSSRRAMASPRAPSPENTDAPSPYGESFASRTASSASETFMIGSVGPNVSSRMIVMSWLTSARTVGSNHCPAPPPRAPPTSTRAPFARASSTWRSTMSTCGACVIAPTSTEPGPAGTPWRSARALSVTFATNAS